jgi:predicted acetyltransferase
MGAFTFFQHPVFTDGEIDVAVDKVYPPKGRISRFFNERQSDFPRHQFCFTLHGSPEIIGYLGLKVAYTDNIVKHFGQVSYGIKEPFRGLGFAANACKLIQRVAADHHMDVAWIMCEPANVASRRTCEEIGCEFVEVIDVPPKYDLYKKGITQACRHRWIIFPVEE